MKITPNPTITNLQTFSSTLFWVRVKTQKEIAPTTNIKFENLNTYTSWIFLKSFNIKFLTFLYEQTSIK